MRNLELSKYVALAEQAEAELFGRGQKAALDALEAEHQNLLDVLDEAYHADRAAGIRIGVAVWRFWLLRGHLAEGRARLARLLDGRAEVPPRLKARGMTVLGVIAFFQGDNVFAERCALESLALAGRLDDAWGVAFSKTVLGWSAQAGADYDRAQTLFREGLALFRRMGHRWGEAVSLLNLGEVARSRGELDAAEQFYQEDLAIYRELDEQSAIAATLCNLGYVALHRGDLRAAGEYFRETMLLCRQLGNKQFAVGTFIGLAGVAAARRDDELAAKLLGAADALLAQIKGSLEPADVIERDRLLEGLRDRLGADKFAAAREEGKALATDEAVGLALAES